jgi:hypothetical protein
LDLSNEFTFSQIDLAGQYQFLVLYSRYLLPNYMAFKTHFLFFLGSLKTKKKGQVLEFQNVPGCGLRALVGHLQDLTEAGKQSEDILNYVNLRQKVGLENIALCAF